MRLIVSVKDNFEQLIEFTFAKTKEEAEEKVANMDCWEDFGYANAYDVRVDGRKVILKK